MSSYLVHGSVFTGSIKLTYNAQGRIQSFDFSNAALTDKSLTDIFTKMPITEAEFLKRANGGGTNYEKL